MHNRSLARCFPRDILLDGDIRLCAFCPFPPFSTICILPSTIYMFTQVRIYIYIYRYNFILYVFMYIQWICTFCACNGRAKRAPDVGLRALPAARQLRRGDYVSKPRKPAAIRKFYAGSRQMAVRTRSALTAIVIMQR